MRSQYTSQEILNAIKDLSHALNFGLVYGVVDYYVNDGSYEDKVVVQISRGNDDDAVNALHTFLYVCVYNSMYVYVCKHF